MSGLFNLSWRRRAADAPSAPPVESTGTEPAPTSATLAERVLAGLPGAVLVVVPDGTIEHMMSPRAHALLGTAPLEGMALHAALGMGDDDAAAGLLQMWLASVDGADERGWAIHADEPPITVEMQNDAGGEPRRLQLDYAPLYQGGLVDRILVMVRPAPPERIDLASGAPPPLSGLTPESSSDHVEVFVCEARGLLAECNAAFERLRADPAARHAVHKLFRSLHTLKGNARTFGMGAVQEAAHEAEDHLEAVRSAAQPVGAEALALIRAQLDRVSAQVHAVGGRVQTTIEALNATRREVIDDAEALQRALARFVRASAGSPDELTHAAVELSSCAARLGITALAEALAQAAAVTHPDPAGAAAVRLDRMVSRLWTLLEELRRAPLPPHFVAELGRTLDELEPLLDGEGASSERELAVALVQANAVAFGISTVDDAATSLGALLDRGGPARRQAFVELRELLAACRAVAPMLTVTMRVDALALFQEGARPLLSAMERDLQRWSARPRERQTIEALWRNARLYAACARRFGMTALLEHAGAGIQLLDEALRMERPQRSLVARVEQWLTDVDVHLAFYQSFQVEVRSSGPEAAGMLEALDAVAARRQRGDAQPLLAGLVERAEQLGLLSLSASAGGGEAGAARLLRLCTDVRSFVVEASSAPPRAASVPAASLVGLRTALAAFERALGQAPALGPAQPSWLALRRAIDQAIGVPLAELMPRLEHCAGDVAAALGKQVCIEVELDALALDATVQRKLGEMLLHLVRNAVDHGIESAPVRMAAGKPARGRLGLRASEDGDCITIELSDDGAGIDVASVKARALQQRLAEAEELARMSDEEACALIFHPGLSTRLEVTRLSGRGVGMDVVASLARELGGSVRVSSAAARGTTVSIRLPRPQCGGA